MTGYFVFRIVVAFVLGAGFYIVDRSVGVRLYRLWYNMTHEHRLPDEVVRGFVANRRVKIRVFWAVMLATFVTVLSFFNGPFYPLLEISLWAAAALAALIGVLIGPRLFALWQKRDNAFDAVDKWERGEVDLSDELKARTAEFGARLSRKETPSPQTGAAKPPSPDEWTSSSEIVSSPLPPAPRPVSEPPTAPPPDSIETQDPQQLVDRYLNRGETDKRG